MRIIAGSAKGRRFDAPVGRAARPTGDRVKESLFAIIHFQIEGARVLDLFSGSGSLTFEALSRGAASAVANDSNELFVRAIKKNAVSLGFNDRLETLCLDADEALCRLASKGDEFDFIFLDPPYSLGLEYSALERIYAGGMLASGGKIVLEQDVSEELNENFKQYLIGARVYGQTKLTFLLDEPTNIELE